jgi:hypothetical protein
VQPVRGGGLGPKVLQPHDLRICIISKRHLKKEGIEVNLSPSGPTTLKLVKPSPRACRGRLRQALERVEG